METIPSAWLDSVVPPCWVALRTKNSALRDDCNLVLTHENINIPGFVIAKSPRQNCGKLAVGIRQSSDAFLRREQLPTSMTSAPTLQPKFLPKRDELGLVAVGFSGGQCKPGVDAAPLALMEAGLTDQLKHDLAFNVNSDGKVHNYEDICPQATQDPDHRGMKKPRAVSAVCERLSKQVYDHAVHGRFVLTLGGDHSIAMGTISGTQRATKERLGRDVAVVWVDAHTDINTPETSDSGNIHGMPVAFLTGLAKEERKDMFGWIQDEHRIGTRKIVYIGLRDVDRGEKKILRDHGIKAFSMHDIDR